MSVRIILDSTTNVPAALKGRFDIVPLTVRFGSREYLDGVTLDERRFYEMLIESDTLPTTSQGTPAAFTEAYAAALQKADQVLVLTLSSRLSGTYQSAVLAAREFPAGKIFVVDTMNVTIGAGVLAVQALRMADGGTCAEEIAAYLEAQKEHVRLVALVDTLEYLQKGGRLSKAAAIAGSLLSIKPVICIGDGQVQVLGKARGSRQGSNLLVQEIQKAGGVDFDRPVLLGYTGLSDLLLQKYIEDSSALWADAVDRLDTCVIGSVIGTHVGPGAIAVAFFHK